MGSRHSTSQLLAFIPLVVALAVGIASCGSGVPEKDFEALQEDLLNERAQSQALSAELTEESAHAARLSESIDEAEMQRAEIESRLAQDRATITGLQKRVDEAEVQATLLATYLAWNRRDQEVFRAGFTDSGFSNTLLSLPESTGDPPIALRRVMDAEVSGDTATIHAMFALGTQRNSIRHSMVKEAGAWRIDDEERMSPKIGSGTKAVDVRIEECNFAFGSNTLTDGSVAFKVENASSQPHHLILARVPDDLDPFQTFQRGEAPRGIESVAFVDTLTHGYAINMAFTEPLDSGRYLLLCYESDPNESKPRPLVATGIVAEFMVQQ